jgi:hypothetical protein
MNSSCTVGWIRPDPLTAQPRKCTKFIFHAADGATDQDAVIHRGMRLCQPSSVACIYLRQYIALLCDLHWLHVRQRIIFKTGTSYCEAYRLKANHLTCRMSAATVQFSACFTHSSSHECSQKRLLTLYQLHGSASFFCHRGSSLEWTIPLIWSYCRQFRYF